MRHLKADEDDGTVLLLVIGLVSIAALLVGVVTDVTALYLKRRTITSAVDGAALAGAQEVNRPLIYGQGLPSSGPVPLDERAAEEAALRYLRDTAGDIALRVEVQATPTTVTVQVWTDYRLPASSRVTLGTAGTVAVTATATARTAVVP